MRRLWSRSSTEQRSRGLPNTIPFRPSGEIGTCCGGCVEPLVSILINNYNFGHLIGDAIDSALAQTYTNCQVIVVDDGSRDNSRDVISGFGNRIKAVFKSNGGQSSALNVGFAESKGEV